MREMDTPRKFLLWSGAVALSACIGAFLYSPSAGTGMVLGVLGTSFSLVVLWLSIGLAGRMASTEQTPRAGTFLLLLAFFVKLPLFGGLILLSQRIGGDAPTCFLLGLALVYSAMVGWAQVRNLGRP